MGTAIIKVDDYVVLTVLKAAIKLEIVGLRRSKGKSAVTRAKEILKLPKGTSKERTLEIVTQVVEDHLKTNRAPVGQEAKE